MSYPCHIHGYGSEFNFLKGGGLMKGTVLDFNEAEGTGIISAEDGNRYPFSIADVKGTSKIVRASNVDFAVDDGVAKDIYKAVSSVETFTGEKNKIVAGVLALFLGAFGVHKFYLGRMKQGVIMVVVFFLGFILLGIPSMVIGIIAFVEGIIYLLKPEDEFQRLYIDGDKAWF